MAATFNYKTRDSKGNLQTGEMEASSAEAVARALRDRGYAPIAIEEQRRRGLSTEIRLPFSNRVRLKDVAVFSRQFATMINSGLSLLRSLSILISQTDSRALADVLEAVKSDVDGGASLSAGMEKHPKAFGRLYVAMVKAGEVGGVLDETLIRLADTLEKQLALRAKIRSAMMYPVAVFALVLVIVSAMLLVVVPMFETLYEDLGGTLPLPTKLLLQVSSVVQSMWWLVGAAGIGAAVGLQKWKATPHGREMYDKVTLRIPIFGGLVHKTAIARFSHTLSSLVKTGVPILQSMDIVAETSGNAVVSAAVRDAQSSIKEGESIAEPLRDHEVFPPMVIQMIAVGEETGALDAMLDKVGSFYDREVTATVEGLTSLIEPLLIVLLGVTVGGMLVALYLPMFNVINLIQ